VKLVQQCVLHNPRLTTEEVLAMAKNRSLHGELLRLIAGQRDWVRQYSIRVALVLNPKTPLQMSLSLLPGINDRDVRLIAKSRNVPTVVQSQARRMLLRKTAAARGRDRAEARGFNLAVRLCLSAHAVRDGVRRSGRLRHVTASASASGCRSAWVSASGSL
jgi:hypothetical protein